MIHELESVALTTDLRDHGLEAGDVGKVVHRYAAGDAYEVEFLAGDGTTLAVLTLEEEDLRPLERSDTFHVRTGETD